jgi:hypothetical protein
MEAGYGGRFSIWNLHVWCSNLLALVPFFFPMYLLNYMLQTTSEGIHCHYATVAADQYSPVATPKPIKKEQETRRRNSKTKILHYILSSNEPPQRGHLRSHAMHQKSHVWPSQRECRIGCAGYDDGNTESCGSSCNLQMLRQQK